MNTLMRSRMIEAKVAVSSPPDELHQARPDQVPYPLHIAHDARHQDAGLVRVVEGHRQPPDVGLHLAAQVGDQALRSLREELSQRVRRNALHRRGADHCQHQRNQELK